MISGINSPEDIKIYELNFLILEFALPKLKQFRKMTTSYPATFEYMSMETWLETLDNMIEEIETSIKEEEVKVPLFLKHFNHLWI
jgi:hypothetical protein